MEQKINLKIIIHANTYCIVYYPQHGGIISYKSTSRCNDRQYPWRYGFRDMPTQLPTELV